jgi:hypothetical protein
MLPKYRFRVDVENQPRRIVTTAAEAVAFGMRHVYLPPARMPKMMERLDSGKLVAWSYGFASVEIAPQVAGRR